MRLNHFFSVVICLTLLSCSVKEKIYVVAGQDDVIAEAGHDLARYLSETYPHGQFEVVTEQVPGSRNILLQISDDTTLLNDEAYRISGDGQSLFIRGKTPRALVHGVYGLLKQQGWNFYLSFEVPPVNPVPLDFSAIQTENVPLKETRMLFNWHNFLSGCTGWDYEQWQEWTEQASKIGFNTIMVHAYGNNPMHSFSFNGQEKELGYLTTTQKGRDWGAQHVNDVRLLAGGEIFKDPEFGSMAAKVPENERVQSATTLMQQVFRHAALKGMDVCFAVDVDTWMANPQNIIQTLPGEALIEIGGYKTVNPEHPEGKKYYKAQLTKLFSDYPEITMLSAWMRKPVKKPSVGSIWLLHESNTLPGKWKQEYFDILKNYPELKDERPYPGLFALSKIVKVYREILDEIKPEVELALGSWDCDFTEQADPFMPDYCSFIPLDYSYILDQPGVMTKLREAGKNRKVYPVAWAHHDDHRYIGRPYIPYSGFNQLLDETNASGYGIIHWMTHPLDLLFNNYENQVWQNSENETLKKAVADFARSLLKREDENLVSYLNEWFVHAPMFGRETSDNFLRLKEEYNLDGYGSSLEVVEKAEQRLAVLNAVDTSALNSQGKKEYDYQKGMEHFIISLFNNHHDGHEAFKLLQEGKRQEAIPWIRKLKPLETIGLYAETISAYGATKGEEGVLISLNLRWLPDYIDLKQQTGLEPVRISFQPTSHDPLAQGAGHHTFFIDPEKNFWLSLGEKELGIPAGTNGKQPLEKITDSWLNVSEESEIPLKTMRNSDLPASDYKIQLFFGAQSSGCQVQVMEDGQSISSFHVEEGQDTAQGIFSTRSGKIMVKIIPENGIVKVAGLMVQP
jgi:hypothetical protein